jgi:hypothetical protein
VTVLMVDQRVGEMSSCETAKAGSGERQECSARGRNGISGSRPERKWCAYKQYVPAVSGVAVLFRCEPTVMSSEDVGNQQTGGQRWFDGEWLFPGGEDLLQGILE